ncbi:MAG: DUF177 domain-containing protein [Magnetococcales bacterium]|nr:DUF177 domain-containing protein [Magnetococcales bacterium]MBF0630885.1 DUF177 domain-containing protein [Magnetococcales bacterium]
MKEQGVGMILDGLVIGLDAKSHREKHVSGEVSSDNLPLLKDNLAPSRPVMVDVMITRSRDQWCVSGTLTWWMHHECSRCLEPFQREQKSVINRLFCVGSDPFQDQKTREMDDDLTCLVSGELAIGDLVQEEILLDLPMIPVCSDDCRGLCPQCGINRNLDDCQCEGGIREGPFSKLKELDLSRKNAG